MHTYMYEGDEVDRIVLIINQHRNVVEVIRAECNGAITKERAKRTLIQVTPLSLCRLSL